MRHAHDRTIPGVLKADMKAGVPATQQRLTPGAWWDFPISCACSQTCAYFYEIQHRGRNGKEEGAGHAVLCKSSLLTGAPWSEPLKKLCWALWPQMDWSRELPLGQLA